MTARLPAACIGMLLLSPQAIADDEAASPSRMAVTLAPLILLQPRAALELDLTRPNRFRIAGSLSIGRQNGLGMRLNNLGLDAAGLDPLRVHTIGTGVAVERFVHAPDRGVYAGGTALLDRYRHADSTEAELGYTSLRIGPTVGWKGITDRGLTISIDAGPAYGGVFALVGYPPLEAQSVPRSSFTIIGSMQLGYAFF